MDKPVGDAAAHALFLVVVNAVGVKDDNRLDIGPGPGGHIHVDQGGGFPLFVERADPPGQNDAGIGPVEHALFPRGQGPHHHFLGPGQGGVKGGPEKGMGDDTVDVAAGLLRGLGDWSTPIIESMV